MAVGFFSAVRSLFRARRDQDEAAVRSRLARRSLGRKLAFVSFNLEVLLFVYAFWKARRRNLYWRQPIQALPMLVIPALATLVYAAFIRFTRISDLRDKKILERLQEEEQENDCAKGELDQNEQNSAKKCDLADDASNLSTAAASTETFKLRKHHKMSTKLRDDGGKDISWGHSNDFQPMQSDSLRQRKFSAEKTYMTNSSALNRQINSSPEHLSDGPEDPNYMQMTVEHHSKSGGESAIGYSSVETSPCLPDCSMQSNPVDHNECSIPLSSPKSNGGLVEYDTVQTGLTVPKLNPPTFAELLPEGVEEKKSFNFHASGDNRVSIPEKELSVSPYAVKNTEHRAGTSGITLCNQETEKEDVAGGVCFVKASPELRFLSSPELVVEGSKDACKKESCELNKQEKYLAVNSEYEALLGAHVVPCNGGSNSTDVPVNSGFFWHHQDPNAMEVPAAVNIFAVSPESNDPASVGSLAEDDEGSKGDETPNLHLPEIENKGQEAFLHPLVVDSYEDSFASSDLLSHSVVKEDLSELQDSGAYNHQNSVAASSDDGGNLDNLMGDAVSVQFIPEANMMKGLQGGEETNFGLPNCSSCHPVGIFVSSREISTDEAYSSNSNSYCLYANPVDDKAPLVGQGGCSESKDEMNFAFLDTPILLSEVTSADSWTDNAACSQCIPETDGGQSLHDGKQTPHDTSERANFDIKESLTSPDQEMNSEIFSLYSRSSSCVSEVNVVKTLVGGTFLEAGNDHDSVVPSVNYAENYKNNARTESIPEGNMIIALTVGNEETTNSVHEVCSTILNDFRAADVGKDMGDSDNYLDLLSPSFVPVVDVFEGLQAGQGFSEQQCESDYTFHKKKALIEEVKNEENYTIGEFQDSVDRSSDAMQFDHSGLSKLQDKGTVGSHFFSQNGSPESRPQDILSFHGLDNEQSSLCSAQVNLFELLDVDQSLSAQKQYETNLGLEDMHMVHQGCPNSSGYQQISDANMVETLHGAERLSSEIIHDGIFTIGGTSISTYSSNNAENSLSNSGSIIHTGIKPEILLGPQGLFKPHDEKGMVSIYEYEVNSAEINSSDCKYSETTVTGAVQNVNELPPPSQDEHPGARISSNKNSDTIIHSNYWRSSSSMPGDSLTEIFADDQEGFFEPNSQHPANFEETLICENSPNNQVSASRNSMMDAVRSSEKGLSYPLLEGADRFVKTPGNERATNSLNQNDLSCDQIAISETDAIYTESQECTEVSENVEGFFKPEHHVEPALVSSLVRMSSFIGENWKTEKDSSSSCVASSHPEIISETLQGFPIAAGSEKGFLEDSKVHERHCVVKEPEDFALNDIKENVEDLHEDHEHNSIDLEAAEFAPAPPQKSSVKFYAKDASWRDLAMGTSNDFEVAQVAGLRQRRIVSAFSSSTRSSTVSEHDDKYTNPVDDDTDPLTASQPSPVAVNIPNRSNNKTTHISV